MCLECFKFWHKPKTLDGFSNRLAESSKSPSASLQERLWNEAYNALKPDEERLVEAYEKLLVQRLRKVNENIGFLDKTQITPATLNAPDQMKKFVAAGLEESKQIATVKKNIEEFSRILSPIKEVMDIVVQAAPQAAIPWSCVSFALQILANPLTESSINREGITYVLSTMDWYQKLVGLLINDDNQSQELRDELKKQIVELYRRLLLYQMKSLIYGLAKKYPQVDRYIYDKYKDGGGKEAFQGDSVWGVMCDILKAMLGDLMMDGVLFIVDALDECVDGRQQLLDFICERSADSRGKWIVSSRNWLEIETNLQRVSAHTSTLSLELNSDLVAGAVRTYIQQKVDKLAQKRPYKNNLELCKHVEQYLNNNSNNTFLWAALVCDALRQDKISRPEHVEGPKGVLKTFPKGLDKLYKRMLEYVFDTMDEALCKDVLAVASVLETSVTFLELCSIMGLSQHFDGKLETLQDAVQACGSFLSLRDGSVYFVHHSARDFLLNKEEDTFDLIFPDGIKNVHRAVFLRSLDVVSRVIHRNIYELQDVDMSLTDITMPNPDPLASIAYSCIYWMNHLGESNPASYIEDDGVVHQFLQSKFLCWLEALALLGQLTQAVEGIQKLQNVLRGKPSSKDKGIAELVHDANRFFLYHREMIAEFPLQIYDSALLFSPEESVVRKHFLNKREKRPLDWITIVPGLDISWDTRLLSLSGHESHNQTVAYSPDGHWLLSGSADGTVKLWQADRGSCERTHGGFGEELGKWSGKVGKAGVRSVAFSGDSQLFTAGSWNGMIKVWNMETDQVESFKGHDDVAVATTMAISPDSRTFAYALRGTMIHIWSLNGEISTRTFKADDDDIESLSFTTHGQWLASVSTAGAIKIWDTLTGKCQQKITHPQGGQEITISADGQWIASGRFAVYVWDTKTGRLVWELKHDFEDNGSTSIWSVAFSEDGRLLAASFHDCIRVWSTATGVLTWKSSHCGKGINSLAFSSDSKRLAAACFDRTIKVWDVRKGHNSVAGSRSARSLCYSDEHHFAAYYPDCREIAAWSKSPENDIEVQKFHADDVSIIAISKDHQQLASASRSGQITLWETKTGAQTLVFSAAAGDNRDDTDNKTGSFMGQITSLVFRDSLQLACGSSGTIKIVNTSDGTNAQASSEPYQHVKLMKFSTDGKWLAYTYSQSTYRHYGFKIWDTATDQCFSPSVAESPDDDVLSLSFSKDSRLLLSTSRGTVYFWDVTTGRCIRQLEMYGTRSILASLDAGTKGRLNTQFGFLTIDDPEAGCLSANDPDANICGDGEASAQGLAKALCAKGSSEKLPFHGYGFSNELDWLVLDGRRLLRTPPDYRAGSPRDMTPIINQSTLIWISRTGRLVRLRFSSRH